MIENERFEKWDDIDKPGYRRVEYVRVPKEMEHTFQDVNRIAFTVAGKRHHEFVDPDIVEFVGKRKPKYFKIVNIK